MAMQQDPNKSGGEQFVWTAVAILIAVVAVAWAMNKPISIMAMHSAYWMYRALEWAHLARPDQIELMYQLGAKLELGQNQLSWGTIFALLNDAYRYPGILIGGLIALFGFGAMKLNPLKFYVRRLDLDKVLFQQALVFPEMRPVVGLGKKLLDRTKFDEGPWRLAEMPIQFALKNELLKDTKTNEYVKEKNHEKLDFRYARENYVLDLERAKTALEQQLGAPLYEGGEPNFRMIFKWPKQHRALLAAFILARWASRDDAFKLFAQFSNSFWEPDPKKKKPIDIKDLNMAWVNDILNAWLFNKKMPKDFPWPVPRSVKICESIKDEIKKHAFTNVIMFHMLEKARERGIVVVSDFIWLRPIDRTLFYTLNNAGRHNPKNATGFVEGIGPVAHWQVEEACGKPLLIPDVREAVEGLESSLYEEGWVKESARNRDAVKKKKEKARTERSR